MKMTGVKDLFFVYNLYQIYLVRNNFVAQHKCLHSLSKHSNKSSITDLFFFF